MFCYIHIPFCENKCSYCRFASIGSTQKYLIQKYISHLLNEIKTPVFSKTGVLSSIYFGGGTPSVLEISQIESILKTLKNKYVFDKNIEITLESTPEKISPQNLEDWKNLGINRLSVGIQTLNDTTLREIQRYESSYILQALEYIQNGPIENISLDFIIGLPYLKKGETKKDIEYILKKFSKITHISLYMLEDYFEENTQNTQDLYEKITYPKTWEKHILSPDDFLGEYQECFDFLTSEGFSRYEISNFSKKGFESKHNQAYWDHSPILAFGLGSHGYINNTRYSHSENFMKYYAQSDIFCETLTQKEIDLEKVMFGLRTSGISLSQTKILNQEKVGEFLQKGYLIQNNDTLFLSNNSLTLLDRILYEILE